MNVHCQVCAREIKAKSGIIAHHGYQRPDRGGGWQTDSCPGARAMAWEESSKALAAYVVKLHSMRVSYQNERDAISSEAKPSVWLYARNVRDHRGQRTEAVVLVTRDTFAALYLEHGPQRVQYAGEQEPTFGRIKDKHLNRIDQDIRSISSAIIAYEKRLKTWQQTATFNGVDYVPLERPK